MTGALENLATAAFTVLALALAFVAFRAWAHARSRKILLLAAGFGLFAMKGTLLSVGLFRSASWETAFLLPSLLLDLGALLLFYAAALTRAGA